MSIFVVSRDHGFAALNTFINTDGQMHAHRSQMQLSYALLALAAQAPLDACICGA
jgi:hypothetical protein